MGYYFCGYIWINNNITIQYSINAINNANYSVINTN